MSPKTRRLLEDFVVACVWRFCVVWICKSTHWFDPRFLNSSSFEKRCFLKKVENQPVELSFQLFVLHLVFFKRIWKGLKLVDFAVKPIPPIVLCFQSVDFWKFLTEFSWTDLICYVCFKTDLALLLNVFNNWLEYI